tara:strand:+ start:769 stop:1986 length:1218 start_codon:yes stop_codon:yes gene_type:complete
MEKEIMDEMKRAAELLDMPLDDVQSKFDDICKQNDIDMEKEQLLARGLFRQWYASVRQAKASNPSSEGGDSFFKNAFGFFVSMDDARDMMAMQRDRVVAEYRRDSDTTYNLGKVAVITTVDDGFEMRRMHKGEEVSGKIENLPENHVELDNGMYLVPVDYTEKYGTRDNDNFGKPLPKEEFRRSGVFIGDVNGVLGKFYFNYKGQHSKTFNPKTFEFVHFTCILNSTDGTRIHGATDKTMLSLAYNADLSDDDEKKVDVSSTNVQDEIMSRSEDNYSPLVDLERYHQQVANKTYNDRFVFTDGTVSSVNMTATKNGNRIVNLTDLNADFDYGDEFNSGTTCWVPAHIDIDFGIGSQVIVVGRTSQGTDDEGNLRPVSINVTGMYVIDKRGGPTAETPVEDNVGWF